MFETLKKKIYNIWDGIKAWFKRSETIFLARLEVIVGFLIAAIEGMDWTSITSLDFTSPVSNKQFAILGGAMVVKGLFSEWARRRNDPNLK